VPFPEPVPSNTSTAPVQGCRDTLQTFAQAKTTLILPSPHSTVSAWSGLSPGLCDYERHGFRHFQTLTAPAMQLVLPSSDWIPLALQMSVQTPVLFQAITATGTMARALTVLIHPSFPRPVLRELADEAMRQHCKAIRSLREYVDRALTASVDIEPVLLACLLCVCFEAFRGKKSAAMDHARLGWNIVKNHHSTSLEMEHSPSVRFLDLIIPRYAGAYALFDDKEHHDLDCCPQLSDLSAMVFDSIEIAASSLDRLAKHSEHFRTRLLQLARIQLSKSTRGLTDGVIFCLSACLSRTIPLSDLDQSRLAQLQLAHAKWKAAYTKVDDRLAANNVEANLALQIRHFYSSLTIATCRDSEETPTDASMNEFENVLGLVEHYLVVAKRRETQTTERPQQPQQSMFYGTSVLPTVHLVALKCRDPHLRRRALQILATAHKQEGLEYSGHLSVYAQAAVEIEEYRAAVLTQENTVLDHGFATPSVLPEKARISDCVTIGQGASGVLKVICARYVEGTPTAKRQIELMQYECGCVPLRLVEWWKLVV